jgi:acetolactate synthase small subunit
MSADPWTRTGLCAAVRFTLVADAEPGLLQRLMQPFAKRDLIPDHFDAGRHGTQMRIEIAMHAMPADVVHLVEGNLRQVVGVHSVTRRQEITGMVQRRAA